MKVCLIDNYDSFSFNLFQYLAEATGHVPTVVKNDESRTGGIEAFDALFADIPREFDVVRYHSLAAIEPLPPGLRVTARSADGVVMALEHAHQPLWGVQFHPESIYSEHGKQLLRNFLRLAQRHAAVAP